jgi:hypothetical protein
MLVTTMLRGRNPSRLAIPPRHLADINADYVA